MGLSESTVLLSPVWGSFLSDKKKKYVSLEHIGIHYFSFPVIYFDFHVLRPPDNPLKQSVLLQKPKALCQSESLVPCVSPELVQNLLSA